MKAVVCTGYGTPDVLRLAELERPVPKDHEVLLRVRAATVSTADCRIRGFRSPPLFWIPMRLIIGIRRPRRAVLGVELAGEVVSAGKAVKRFETGDRLFGMTGMRFGAHAEYVCLPESGALADMPSNASFEEAAAIAFGGTTALHFLRKANIARGQKVLVYGASGAVGTSAVQLARYFGAEVTGVCSAANMELVKSLGAERVIDYATEDFALAGERYDIIFDAVGKRSKASCSQALAPSGRFATVEGQGVAAERADDLDFLRGLFEQGALQSVIDRRYSLDEIAEAHRYVDSGRKKGNVVIAI